jgi:hypothetical protein
MTWLNGIECDCAVMKELWFIKLCVCMNLCMRVYLLNTVSCIRITSEKIIHRPTHH